MAKFDKRIDDLFQKQNWSKARQLLEAALRIDPTNHWILTQIGVTHYEQRQYEAALRLFLQSQKIVPDCPLTLWNLGGALDTLGNHEEAIRVYTWLLESKKTADDDPCWEDEDWSNALKADCVYRLGTCFHQLGRTEAAERCYRQYINLLLSGVDGLYSIEEAMRQIRKLDEKEPAEAHAAIDRTIQAALQAVPGGHRKTKRNGVLKFDDAKLLNGHGKAAVKT